MRFEVCLWQISVKFTKKEQKKKQTIFNLLCFISFYVLVMRLWQQPHFCSSNTYYNIYQSHIWGYWLVQGILSQYIFCLLCVLRSCKTSERNKELLFFLKFTFDICWVFFFFVFFVFFHQKVRSRSLPGIANCSELKSSWQPLQYNWGGCGLKKSCIQEEDERSSQAVTVVVK